MTEYEEKRVVFEIADLVNRGEVEKAMTALRMELLDHYQQGYFNGRESR